MSNDIIPPSAEVLEEARSRIAAVDEEIPPRHLDAAAYLLARRRAVLQDDVVLGTSRPVVAGCIARDAAGPHLVVCPRWARRNWAAEAARLDPAAIVELLDGSPSEDRPAPNGSGWTIAELPLTAAVVEHLARGSWCSIVLDEPAADASRAAQNLELALRLVRKFEGAGVHVLTSRSPQFLSPAPERTLLEILRTPKPAGDAEGAPKRFRSTDRLEPPFDKLTLRRRASGAAAEVPHGREWFRADVPPGFAAAELARVVLEYTAERVPHFLQRRVTMRGEIPITALRKSRSLVACAERRLALAKADTTAGLVNAALGGRDRIVVISSHKVALQRIERQLSECLGLLTGATLGAHRRCVLSRLSHRTRASVVLVRSDCALETPEIQGATLIVFNDFARDPLDDLRIEQKLDEQNPDRKLRVVRVVAERTLDDFRRVAFDAALARLAEIAQRATDVASADGSDDPMFQFARVFAGTSDVLAEPEKEDGDSNACAGALRATLRDLAAKAPDRQEQPGQFERFAFARDCLAALHRALAAAPIRTFAYQEPRRRDSRAAWQIPTVYLWSTPADVACSCGTFTRAGSCEHSRSLRAALEKGDALPSGFSEP